MRSANSTNAPKSGALLAAALLAALLALLFWRSFLPGYVHFSNDGPLGATKSDWAQLPGAFTGMWDDLNSIGFSGGAFGASLNTLVFWALGPVGYSKFLAPVILFIFGMCAWFSFRGLGLTSLPSLPAPRFTFHVSRSLTFPLFSAQFSPPLAWHEL